MFAFFKSLADPGYIFEIVVWVLDNYNFKILFIIECITVPYDHLFRSEF